MKLYLADYDLNKPAQKTIEVPAGSKFAIGIAATVDNADMELLSTDVCLYKGTQQIWPDDTFGSYATFNLSSSIDNSAEQYAVVIDKMITTASAYVESEHYEGTSKTVYISGDISQLIGKTLAAEDFGYYTHLSDGTDEFKNGGYIFLDDGTLFYGISLNATTGKYQFYYGADKFDEITITGATKLTYRMNSLNATAKKNYFFFRYVVQEEKTGSLDLAINARKANVCDGFKESYETFGNQVTLSGTYADGTTYSYVVPVK